MSAAVGGALGLLGALVASAGYGSASVLQAAAARRAAAGHGSALVRQPLFLAGACADAASWVVSLAALRVLPLFCVQALLAASLGVTALLGHRVLGTPLGQRDVMALAVVVAGLAVVAAAAAPAAAASTPAGTLPWLTGVLAVLTGTLLVPGRVARSPVGAAALATSAALAYASAAVAARLAVAAVGAGGLGAPTGRAGLDWATLVLRPVWLVVLAGGLLGTVLYGRCLAGGQVVVASAVLWVVEAVVAGSVGVVLCGDAVRPGGAWRVVAIAALVAALAGCALLARPAAPTEGAP